MKTIPLTQGKVALVDDEDYDWLMRWKWCFHNGYAVRNQVNAQGKKEYILMHRLVNGTPRGLDTDHIDRDGLNNRRANLRTVTHQKNTFNSGMRSNNTSGCKGVSWDKRNRKWEAQIKVGKTNIHLGRFKDKSQAIAARKKGEALYHVI